MRTEAILRNTGNWSLILAAYRNNLLGQFLKAKACMIFGLSVSFYRKNYENR